MFLEFEITVNSVPAVSFATLSNFHLAPFAKRRACHVIIFVVLAVGSCINIRSF